MKAERKRFERITETLKEELKWFEQVFTQEIKRVVTASLEALLINEQKVPSSCCSVLMQFGLMRLNWISF